jgi:hypothetical protein
MVHILNINYALHFLKRSVEISFKDFEYDMTFYSFLLWFQKRLAFRFRLHIQMTFERFEERK